MAKTENADIESVKIDVPTPSVPAADVPAVDASAELKAKSKVAKMLKGIKAKLAKEKQVQVKVPIDKQNDKDTEVTVQINGYVFQIKRGVEVTVPAPVKKLLERGGYI